MVDNKIVTSLFDDYAKATEAVSRLESAGIGRDDISLVTQDMARSRYWSGAVGGAYETDTYGNPAASNAAAATVPGAVAAGWPVTDVASGSYTGTAYTGTEAGGNIENWLINEGVTEGDAYAYAEGVRRGGTLVAVRCDDDEVDRVVDILDKDGILDLDQRQTMWRNEGWRGFEGRTAAAGTATGFAGTDRTRADLGRREGEQVIPIVEEELRVGKREVEHGRVRIHSHVVTKPVREQVTLREEHVDVERRPVDRAIGTAGLGNEDLFRERTIEMDETAEEAVVSKEARVREELVVRKDVEEREKTISDEVRRTEVEVEDERGNRLTGTDRDRKI